MVGPRSGARHRPSRQSSELVVPHSLSSVDLLADHLDCLANVRLPDDGCPEEGINDEFGQFRARQAIGGPGSDEDDAVIEIIREYNLLPVNPK
jgi:hypothetical protein